MAILARAIINAARGANQLQNGHLPISWARRSFLLTDQCARSFATARQATSSNNGLFSIPTLQNPTDFVTMAAEAMSACDALRQDLSKYDHPVDSAARATEILHMLDDISKNVCSVIDAAELCRCVHSSREWRDSAGKAFAILSDYFGQLNSDTTLYRALTRVASSPIFDSLTEEEKRFAMLLKAEFERDGIHLPEAKRLEVRELRNHVTQLETLFTQNITHSKRLYETNASWVDAVFQRNVLALHVPQPESSNPDLVTLSTDSHLSDTLLQYSDNPVLRKQVYMVTNTSCAENLDVLDALVDYRHRLALLQGFESYADRFLTDKMAQNQHNVYAFLESLQKRSGGQYRKEMELLSDAKKRVEQVHDGRLEPWDIPFYVGVLKAKNGFETSSVSSYLTVDNCLEGMTTLVHKLFGITMSEQVMEDGERWDGNAVDSEARVRKFVFLDKTGRSLGTLYLDSHPREAKYKHAAHFTVRCGCLLDGTSAKPEYQTPVVALVCNITDSKGGTPGLLNHHEVATLLHEFGHALHSLLSRTTFQHVSGIRAAMDFVETPSHLFENYAWDPQFLSIVARHFATGEAIPEDTVKRLIQSRNEFRSIDIQNQICYSMFDQKLHGVPDPNRGSTTDLFAKLNQDLHIPYAEGTFWHSRFGHLVTYGAGYYGYLYSQGKHGYHVDPRCIVSTTNIDSCRC